MLHDKWIDLHFCLTPGSLLIHLTACRAISLLLLTFSPSTHMQIDDDAPLPPPDFEFDPEGNLWEFDETGAIMNQSLAGPLQPPGPAPGQASARASSQAALDMTEHRADQVRTTSLAYSRCSRSQKLI